MTALEVGLVDSVAWRSEGRVHLVLHLPHVEPADTVEVRLRDGERRVRLEGNMSAAPVGSLVEVSVPGRRLGGGPWRIAVRISDAGTFTRVEARLLARPGQPVALIPGPEPKTRMAEPAPHRQPSSAPAGARRLAARVLGVVRRGARRGHRVLQ